MADIILPATAESDVQTALLIMLRADASVQAIFGNPARVYDDETRGPDYPFALLERHETKPADTQSVPGTEHTFTLAVISRYGGRVLVREALGVLRAAIEGTNMIVPGQHVVLSFTTYADVLRTRDLRAYRGLLRIKIITEEAT